MKKNWEFLTEIPGRTFEEILIEILRKTVDMIRDKLILRYISERNFGGIYDELSNIG